MLERASSTPHDSEGLSARRRRRERRGRVAFFLLLLFLLAAAVYGLQQNSVRISNVLVYGEDQSLSTYVKTALQGRYLGLIPRDSIFFFPASRIRTDILEAHPNIAAVSIFRNGFTGISIKPNERVPVARWCGLAPTEGVEEYCYIFDASGYIFAAAASTTKPINRFTLYAPLVDGALEPLRATVAHATIIPQVFDFARQLDTQGSPVTKVIVHDDEVDALLQSGTRISYVLGHERDAFSALVSSRDALHLADGSIEYVDLRFEGKVYLKRKE